MYQAVIYDLDGTLADTLGDIATCMNRVLGWHGSPGYDVAAYRYLVGNGMRVLCERALGDAARDATLLDRVEEEMRAEYGAHNCDNTGPYAGIPELLETLTDRGLGQAVLSNKPQAQTEDMVHRLFGTERFALVRGQVAGIPLKPDPTSLLQIAADLGLPVESCLMVGDTSVDMETARRAGLASVGVLWGFREEEELRASGAGAIIAAPEELLQQL